MSIADAIRPPVVAMRRGHSVSQGDDLCPIFLFPHFRLVD